MNPITQICKEQQINRSELSRRSGISYPTLTVIERGLVGGMRQHTAKKIAEFSGKKPEDIKRSYAEWKAELKAV